MEKGSELERGSLASTSCGCERKIFNKRVCNKERERERDERLEFFLLFVIISDSIQIHIFIFLLIY